MRSLLQLVLLLVVYVKAFPVLRAGQQNRILIGANDANAELTFVPYVNTSLHVGDERRQLSAVQIDSSDNRSTTDDHPTVVVKSDFIVVHRPKRVYSGCVLVLGKGYYLVKRSEYVPLETDEVAEWEVRHKANNLTALAQFPILIRCYDGSCTATVPPASIKLIYAHRYTVLAGNLTEILNHPDVLFAEPMPTIRSNSYHAMETMYTPAAPIDSEQRSRLGEGVTIAISDTGLDYFHAAFYDSTKPTPRLGSLLPDPDHAKVASYVTAIPGYTDYACEDGCHGTSVVGAALGFATAFGETGNAPGAKVAFYDTSPNNKDTIHFIDAHLVEYLLDVCDPQKGGATVVSVSWGSSDSTGAYDILGELFDEIALQRKHCSFTVACGNDGPTGICSSPSNAKNVDSVGASFSRPEAYELFWPSHVAQFPERYTLDTVVDFSSTGPLPDGRMAPIFYAPGVYEILPYGKETKIANHLDYHAISGTSFSAPHLAATKAEIQRRYRLSHGGETPSAELVRAILIALSEPMNGQVMRIQAGVGAVPLAVHPPIRSYGVPRLPQQDLDLGGTSLVSQLTEADPKRAFCMQAADPTKPIVVGLAWFDVPGSSLVNDLDVRVFANHTPAYPIYYDGSNPHDRMEFWVSQNHTTARLLIYETDGIIQGGTQTFALHASNVLEIYECGTCQGFDVQTCGSGGVGVRLCNVTDGNYLPECFIANDTVAAAAVEDQPDLTPCQDAVGSGYYANGTCVHTVCALGFYVISEGECGCIPGTETACVEDDFVQLCASDGKTYTSCYSKYSTTTPKVEASPSNQVRNSAPSLYPGLLSLIVGLLSHYLVVIL